MAQNFASMAAVARVPGLGLASQPFRERYRRRISLAHVEEESKRAEALGSRAQHIGSAYIAAARLTDILLAYQQYEQETEWYRAEQIGGPRECLQYIFACWSG